MEQNKSISFELHKTSLMIKRRLDREVPCDPSTTGHHGRIIGFIYENRDRDIFQRDIEKEFNIRRSTATNTLKLMEKNGLITRVSVESDARLKKIELTEKAYDFHHVICSCFKNLEKTLAEGISSAELEVFFSVLEKVNDNLKEEDADA